MTSGSQLERTLLEAKERDELQTIAQAMSLKTSARASKATLIGAILDAAGVDASEPRPAEPAAASSNGDRSNGDGSRDDGSHDDATELVSVGAPLSTSTVSTASTEPFSSEGGVDVARGPRPPQGGAPYDPANRRNNRRRRGRDRERGGERGDLQGAQEQSYSGELVEVRGLLDLRDEGYGFVRTQGYLPSTKDVYVSISQAKRFSLRKGDSIEGACRPAASNEKYPALLRIDSVSGLDAEEAKTRRRF
jgi:transcription termination factor Rho